MASNGKIVGLRATKAMTRGVARLYHALSNEQGKRMNTEQLIVTLLGLAVIGILVYWIGYQSGRMHGYIHGLERGTKLSSQVQHLKGMSDGYVMALQHTPGQRKEFMNNVLLRTGAITHADIEADRKRRAHAHAEA